MKLVSNAGTIPGSCGVGYLSSIQRDEGRYNGFWQKPIGTKSPGGIGMLISGFVNEPECREAYLQLCKKWDLVYQSPVRRNSNSRRQFFMAVFDTKKRIMPRSDF